MSVGEQGYWLGDSPAEVRHLVAQAEVYAEEAAQLLDRIGLDPGAAAIDVGCGVLGILHLLADRVGPDGRVVGVDLEPRLLGHAGDLAARRGLRLETVQADAAATGLEGDSFDLVHERTVLLNVGDPPAVVAEMVRLARPGGVVALEEPDSSGWVCDPPHPAFDRLRDELLAAYERTGRAFDWGRQAARLLREAGLEDVQVRATARVTAPGDFYQTFLPTLCDLLRDAMLAGGTIRPDELDAGVAALRAHLAQPGSLTCQPIMWQAWGRKPPAA